MGFINNRRASRRRLAIGASFAALALAGPAFAQDEAAPEADAVPAGETAGNVITVTAQFREQNLQDTPIAITAMNSEMMEARSQTQLSEVVRQAPSVDLRPATGAFGPSISASIRGLGQGDFNPAMEPGVGLYIDDVYYPRLTGANFDLMDIERVEVLRGPQGTLTGRNSEGGAIKFFTRRPTGDTGGYVQATYGSRNRINVRAAAEFPITDTLSGRITGAFADQEGYVDRVDYDCANPTPATVQSGPDCVVDDLGDVGYRAVRGTLNFEPTDAISLLVSADYIKDVRNQAAEILIEANNPNPNVATADGQPYDGRFLCGPTCNYSVYSSAAMPFFGIVSGPVNLPAVTGDPRSRYEGWGVSANLSVDLSDMFNVVSISAYREWNTNFSVDGDLSPANTGFGLNELDHWFVSQELRLNVDLGDIADLTVGGYYSDERTTYWTLQDIRYVAIPTPGGPLPLFPLQFIGNDPVNTDSKAAFATLILSPLENLTVTLGGRYTDEHKDYTFFRYNVDGTTINPFLDPVGAVYGIGYSGPDTLNRFPGPPAPPNGTADIVTALSGRTANYDGDRLDYRASVDYRFNDQILAYATIASGFKGGGVVPRPFTALQAAPFGVEEVTTYEVGLKTDLFDRNLRFNVTGFWNEFKDQQLTLLSCPGLDPGAPSPCAAPQNAGDSRQKGIELEFTATPIEGVLIDGSASYLDSEYKCVNPAVVGLPDGPCSNDPAVIGRLADPLNGWKWAFGAQYEAQLGGNNGTITPRIDVSRSLALPGNVLRGADTLGNNPAYTLANGRITWRNADEDLSVSLEVTNIFDKYYFVNKFDLRGVGAGALVGQLGRPREWALTVKKEF
jgi:iron complex outermembrane receptor protein